MDKLSMFASDSAAMSCLVMYRMGGLRHVLLYLHDMLRQFLPVVRINALFCTPDGGTIISMSDTSTVNVSNKYSVAGRLPPLVDREHITDDVVLRDLRPYQKPEMLKDKRNEDVPYLHHRALMRLPLFHTGSAIFVFNFWADEPDVFGEEDAAGLRRLLGPLAEELRVRLSGIKLYGAPPSPVTGLGGTEKVCLCPGLAGVRRMAEQAARVDSAVLIMGETGVGKEAVADMIHELSVRRDGPLIKVNCGAIPESLLDSELFGHEKGAFTGAQASRPGYFEMAEGGTLFLDEIGEMSLSAQVRLLRVLDGGMLRRVGGTKFFRWMCGSLPPLMTICRTRWRTGASARICGSVFPFCPSRFLPLSGARVISRIWSLISSAPRATRWGWPLCRVWRSGICTACIIMNGRAMCANWNMWWSAPCWRTMPAGARSVCISPSAPCPERKRAFRKKRKHPGGWRATGPPCANGKTATSGTCWSTAAAS